MTDRPGTSAASRHVVPRTRGFRFVLVSGAGWVLDIAVFVALVALAQVEVLAANLVGGVCGAVVSFLTSNRWVFVGRSQGIVVRLAVYLTYTLALIVAASALVDITARVMTAALSWLSLRPPRAAVAFAAKCAVTPLTLAVNFFVARYLIERWGRPAVLG